MVAMTSIKGHSWHFPTVAMLSDRLVLQESEGKRTEVYVTVELNPQSMIDS